MAAVTQRIADGAADEAPAALFFHCAGLQLALAIEAVQRASYLTAAQPVPAAPDYLVGVTRLAGETVPLIDLAARIGLEGVARYDVDTPVIWCRSSARIAGLVVERIEGVLELGRRGVEMRRAFADARGPFAGAVRAHGRDSGWLLLDPERLLAFDFGLATTELVVDLDEVRSRLSQLTEQAASQHAV